MNKLDFYKCTNTQKNFDSYLSEFLNKSLSVFNWNNLPENIDSDMLEFFLLMNGSVAFFKNNNLLYASHGTPAGVMDGNYIHKEYIVTNPYISENSLNLIDGENCVVIYNSPMDKQKIFGSCFRDVISRTSGILADNLSSLNCLQINSRVQTIVTADTSTVAKSAEEKLKDMYEGKPYAVITSNLASTINIDDKNNAQSKGISELINLNNYMYAQFLHFIGIRSNETEKKERLITSEINENDVELKMNLNIMLNQRKKAVEKINKLFDTDISIDVSDFLKEVKENESE